MLLALLVYFSSLSTVSAFYDPGSQRWLNRDPIGEGGGVNLYAYVGNDPVNEADPEGMSSLYEPGMFEQLWEGFKDPNGYTSCYAKCMLGLGLGADAGMELGGATYGAKKWYSWTDGRFKAGGKYSKKLVPKLASKLALPLALLSAKDALECYEKCKCKL